MQLPWRDVPVGVSTIRTSLTAGEADVLAELASGRLVLEVGSAFGFSAVTMAHGGARHVLAVDPHGDLGSLAMMRGNLFRHDCHDRVTILLGSSRDVLPALCAARALFGLVFIDGDHSEEAVRDDERWARELLTPEAHLAFHDYGEATCPGVAATLDRLYPPGPRRLVDTLWVR